MIIPQMKTEWLEKSTSESKNLLNTYNRRVDVGLAQSAYV
jgi:hypothetical protein